MGVYLQLDCIDCDASLSFGKPNYRDASGKHDYRDGSLSIGLFSEERDRWEFGFDCWRAVQAFLFRHRNHRLVFRKDDSAAAQEVANHEEFDDLLRLWKSGVPYD